MVSALDQDWVLAFSYWLLIGNKGILYRYYIRIIFPYSVPRTSKFGV